MAKEKTTDKATRKATCWENAQKGAMKSTAKKAAKPKAANASPAKSETAKAKISAKNLDGGRRKPSEKLIVDRRVTAAERRKGTDRRNKGEPVAVERRKIERRAKVNRRRQIDPTTCERDYTNDELEFMNALDEYKRASGRMFPTCSEVLEVIKGLGYEKRLKEEITDDEETNTPIDVHVCEKTPHPSRADVPLGFEEYDHVERVVF